MELKIESNLPLAEAERRLKEALRVPRLSDRVFPARSFLEGDVHLPHVRARRYRGNANFLEFEGRLVDSHGTAVLEGRLVPPEYSAVVVTTWGVAAFSGLLTLVAVGFWQWPESLLVLALAGALAAMVPALVKFRHKNIEAEAVLIRRDLEAALSRPDV